jgi:hypothetical protein
MTRPRIADDFVVIRARIEEMRRERAQASAEQDGRSVTGPKPHNVKSNSLSKLEGHYCALIRRGPAEDLSSMECAGST